MTAPGPDSIGAGLSALVLTVSDRSAAGTRPDLSGPLAHELLTAAGFTVTTALVPDHAASITAALREAITAGQRLVITTGGTGIAARDVTPEATAVVVERTLPGVAELVRRSGSVPTAALSRATAGTAASTLIVNLAGSPGAVREGIAALLPLLGHALSQLAGADH